MLPKIINIFVENDDINIQREALKLLKSSCTRGSKCQLRIVKNETLLEKIAQNDPIPNSFVQLLANTCVQNAEVQSIVFHQFQYQIINGLKNVDTCNAYAMLLYQVLLINKSLNGHLLRDITSNLLVHIGTKETLPDFISLNLEFLVTECPDAVCIYKALDNQKLRLLYFIVDFIKDDENKAIEMKLFQTLITEFKRKSDKILKPDESGSNTCPKEIYTLLELIAYASCNKKYSFVLHSDASLFINLGCKY